MNTIIRLGCTAIALALPVSAHATATDSARRLLEKVLPAPKPAATTTPAAIPPASTLTQSEASSGLRLALDKASVAVVDQLGKPGGFANDPKVRIPLPGPLAKLGGVMSLLDKSGLTKDLAGKLNSAAETSVSKALPLLKGAITKMSAADALAIVSGGPTSATDYFRKTMGSGLQAELRPVVANSLGSVKAYAALDGVMAKSKLASSSFGGNDLTGYVTQKTSDGLFLYLAEQEKSLRANPLASGSALLAKLFGGK